MHLRLFSVSALALAASACASGGSQSTDASPPAPVETMGIAETVSWSGNLQPTQSRPSTLTSGSQRNKVFGTVTISPVPANIRYSRARLMVNMPATAPKQTRWAILPGRCGSNSLPLSGFEVYPAIEVNNTGRGEIDLPIPVALSTTGDFHVNIYDGGQQIDNVVSCANLRMNRR